MKLNEYTRDEWFAVARQVKPDLTREQYEQMWERFCEAKAEHLRKLALQ